MNVSILFVDDEALILNGINRALRSSEFQLYFVQSAAQALALVERTRIDIVVSDQMMPEMSGVELLTRLRHRHRDIVRILMTGFADRNATIRAINDGRVSAYLEKPSSEEQLKEVLAQAALDVVERRPQLAAPNPRAALRSFRQPLAVSSR